MSKFQDDVIRFNTMYGLPCAEFPTTKALRAEVETQLRRFHKMLTDELTEIEVVLSTLEKSEEEFLTELADWLGDIQVYAASEMRKFGLPNDEVLDIIMQSNFSKLGADGKAIIVDGKLQKGPNYWKPEPKLLEMIHDKITGDVPATKLETRISVPEAMKVVTAALIDDPEYAWSWHCNITMAQVDEGNDHAIAEHGSMRFLSLLTGQTLKPAHPLRPKPPAPVVEPAKTPKTYAHTTQVGGNHYAQGDKPQHWDLSIMYQWDPFQYQITKYVMRWKDKHPTAEKKLEDLKKARSFLDKYIDNYGKFIPHREETVQDQASRHEVVLANGEEEAKKYFTIEGYWGSGINLYKCKACRTEVRARTFLEAHQYHGCEVDSQAGPGYANQG